MTESWPEYPTNTCPKCAHEQIDLDGFGFITCEACGYCTHPSFSGEQCEFCGAPDYPWCEACGEPETVYQTKCDRKDCPREVRLPPNGKAAP